MTDLYKVDGTIVNIERGLAERGITMGKIFWISCSPERAYLVWDHQLTSDKRLRIMYGQKTMAEAPLAVQPMVIRVRMYPHLPAFHRWTVATADQVNARSHDEDCRE